MYVAAVDTAAGVLSDLGHEVVDIEPPFDPDVMTLFGAVWAVLAALPPPRGGSEEAFTPLVRWLRERARTASAIDLGQALAGLQARVATATARLDRVDLTLCPISLPLGATADGRPVGAMLGGRPGLDRTLLGVAAAVERERPWLHDHPEIWRARPHS